MEDFDEADEQNEEDLMLLGDEFANVNNLKDHLIEQFSDFISNKAEHKKGKAYIQYCMSKLHDDDQVLANTYLIPIFSQKPPSSNVKNEEFKDE